MEKNEFKVRISKQFRNYSITRKAVDDRFGEVLILKNQNGTKKVMATQTITNSKEEAIQLVNNAKFRIQLNSPSIIKCLDYSAEYNSDFCSEFYTIMEYYEVPRTDLKKDIENRVLQNNPFSDSELEEILDSLLKTVERLAKSNSEKAHDITPRLLGNFLTSSGKSWKYIERRRVATTLSLLLIQNFKEGKPLYCSPEVFEVISNEETQHKFTQDQYNSNSVFTLGMIILEAGTLMNLQSCYNKLGCSFNKSQLELYLDVFFQRYSKSNSDLVAKVFKMLEPDLSRRSKLSDLIYQVVPELDFENTHSSKQHFPDIKLRTKLPLSTILDGESFNESQTNYGAPLCKLTSPIIILSNRECFGNEYK